MQSYNKKLGKLGEDAAERYLKKKGYRILARNYLVRGGELDIIAQKGEYIVFVEVKTRSNETYGAAAAAVTYPKMQRMTVAAQHYLLSVGNTDARFDVIEVYGNMVMGKLVVRHLNHIENAF